MRLTRRMAWSQVRQFVRGFLQIASASYTLVPAGKTAQNVYSIRRRQDMFGQLEADPKTEALSYNNNKNTVMCLLQWWMVKKGK